MFKKIILFFTLLTFSSVALAQENKCSDDYSSLVLSEKTGAILYEKRSDKMSYPASLVKMMTLYLTFDALKHNKLQLNQKIVVSEYGEEIAKVNNGNTLRLKRGDTITVKEAIESVVVKSFNEAAVTLAEAVSGSEWEFVREMNKKASELGMNSTSFRNASGLHDEGQYTNSYDLARLAIALKRDFPQYYHFFSQKSFTYRGQKYISHNHVLLEYKGAEGMKTGFTRASGFNLVSAARKQNDSIISIVLGCVSAKSRDQLTKKLLDICFKKLEEDKSLKSFAKLNIKGLDYCDKDEKEQDHQLFANNFSNVIPAEEPKVEEVKDEVLEPVISDELIAKTLVKSTAKKSGKRFVFKNKSKVVAKKSVEKKVVGKKSVEKKLQKPKTQKAQKAKIQKKNKPKKGAKKN